MERGGERTKIYANKIYDIASLKGIRIGQLEKDCGYSPGYLAKCKRGSSRLSVDAVDEIGRKLEFNLFLAAEDPYPRRYQTEEETE